MDNGTTPLMMKYCVIGNIVKEHLDENGVIRYGTVAFPGGRKIYISRRLWENDVTVLGLSRFKSHYILEKVPLEWIENIRFSKTFDPKVVDLMSDPECIDMWWCYKKEDKRGAMEYARLLNQIKAGNKEEADKYRREIMSRFY